MSAINDKIRFYEHQDPIRNFIVSDIITNRLHDSWHCAYTSHYLDDVAFECLRDNNEDHCFDDVLKSNTNSCGSFQFMDDPHLFCTQLILTMVRDIVAGDPDELTRSQIKTIEISIDMMDYFHTDFDNISIYTCLEFAKMITNAITADRS